MQESNKSDKVVKCYHSITLPPYFYHLITVFLVQVTRCCLTHHVAKSLFHHAPLLEQIVYRLMLEVVHRALAEEGQPRLNAAHACTQCQITEKNQVERDGSSKNGVAAQEVNLDFHRIAHPAENIDVVPCFLIILTGRIVVDAYLMINITVQVWIFLRFEDIVDNRQLADLFCLEVLRLVKYLTVTVTQNIRDRKSVV